jgi:hypothetical protein
MQPRRDDVASQTHTGVRSMTQARVEPLKILNCDWIDGALLIVDFSDGTTAFFTPAELSCFASKRILTEYEYLFQA